MGLTDLLKSFTRASAFGLALYTCGGEEKEGCQTDYDCREPRVCVRGYCEGGNGDNNRDSDIEINGGNGACGNSTLFNWYLSDIAVCSEKEGSVLLFNSDCRVGTSARDRYEGHQEYSGDGFGGCRFIQNFSCSEVNNYPEQCDNYQCALSMNDSLYIQSCGGRISLRDNLWMRDTTPVGVRECEEIRKTSWYTTCFGEGEP